MPPQARRVAVFLVLSSLAMLWTVSATAQDAVLQLTAMGGGSVAASAPSVSCAATCSATATLGTTVVLTAKPEAGNLFESWAGDCLGLQPTCTLLMDGTKLAIASFKPVGDPFTVIHRFLPGGDGLAPSGGLRANGGYLYGVTTGGGRAGLGTIFRELPDGGEHTILHDFLGGASDGEQPSGALIALGGVLYGMTPFGGANGQGTVFRVGADGSGFSLLHSFAGGFSDGFIPYGSLVELGGVLYGMTYGGGASLRGTIFKINQDGMGFGLLHSFATSDGQGPSASLITLGGVLYGMTTQGGAAGGGVIFRINPDGSGFTILHNFTTYPTDGESPHGSLVALGGALYGLTMFGGSSMNAGAVFKINPDGSSFTLLHDFSGYPTDGGNPEGSLVVAGGALYGTTLFGGTGGCSNGGSTTIGCGTIFKINADGGGFALEHSFGGDGLNWPGPTDLLIESGGVLLGTTASGGDGGQGTAFRMNLDASGFALLHSFTRVGATEGTTPYGSVVESGGALYGMTSRGGPGSCRDEYGGVVGCGTIFKINPDGTGYALAHAFAGGAADGSMPHGSLLASGDALFGMTEQGGTSDEGAIFVVNPDGSGYRLLRSFAGGLTDGRAPAGSLIGSDGVLYGMTQMGGTGECIDQTATPVGCGTIFKVKRDGTEFTLLHSFAWWTDGANPTGSLIDSGGTLYGMTPSNSTFGPGTIFKINADGSEFVLLHTFSLGLEGFYPADSPIALGGALYGMTSGGFFAGNVGAIFKVEQGGSGFAVLHSFVDEAGSTGIRPLGSLCADRGWLYGMTMFGGDEGCRNTGNVNTHGCGTVFRVEPNGNAYTVLHAFAGADGLFPQYATPTIFDGSIYGVTSAGGIGGNGVIFRLDIPEPRARRHVARE